MSQYLAGSTVASSSLMTQSALQWGDGEGGPEGGAEGGEGGGAGTIGAMGAIGRGRGRGRRNNVTQSASQSADYEELGLGHLMPSASSSLPPSHPSSVSSESASQPPSLSQSQSAQSQVDEYSASAIRVGSGGSGAIGSRRDDMVVGFDDRRIALEMNDLNRQPCMGPLLRVIQRMDALFSQVTSCRRSLCGWRRTRTLTLSLPCP